MRGECLKMNDSCHLDRPHSDVHHEYYPSSAYKTKLEKEFRELPINKEQICRCLHNAIHALEEPPKKPSVQEMRQAIESYYRGAYGETA